MHFYDLFVYFKQSSSTLTKETVSVETTNITMQVEAGTYNIYGVSIETIHGSSGIHWTDCIYHAAKSR